MEEDGAWDMSVANTKANSDSITVTQSDNSCQQEKRLNSPLTGNSRHQIAPQIDMVNEPLAEDEGWDISVATHKRVVSDSTNITQSDDAGEQGQFPNMSFVSDREMADISSMNMLPFEASFLEYSLGFNSVNILETGHENWDIDSHLNSQMQEPPTLLSNGWLNETPSRMKALSQRLFPAASNMSGSINTQPECEKVSANEESILYGQMFNLPIQVRMDFGCQSLCPKHHDAVLNNFAISGFLNTLDDSAVACIITSCGFSE